jgi:hypothetical protein
MFVVGVITLIDFLTHVANALLMLIDLYVVLHPIHFLHAVYAISAGLIYLIFSIIYFLAGGKKPSRK